MRMALAGIICDGAAKGGRPSRRRDERPMRGPHGGAYRSVSRIPSGVSARCAEEALLRRAGREATAKPPTRVRAVLAKLLRDGVRREGYGVGLVGRVERELLALGVRVVARGCLRPLRARPFGRIYPPKRKRFYGAFQREVDAVHRRLLVRRAG